MLCLSSLLFFFSFSRSLRDPHSFPTRRSSDLYSPHNMRRIASAVRGATLNSSGLPLRRGDADVQLAQLLGRHLARRTQDRKSTRLNSSHLGISYAVFCLKKKNKSPHLTKYHKN